MLFHRLLRVAIATTHPLVHQQFESILRMLLAVGEGFQVQQHVLQAQQQTFGLAVSGAPGPASQSFYPHSGHPPWQQHMQQVPQLSASDAGGPTYNQIHPSSNSQNMQFRNASGEKLQSGVPGQGLGQPPPTQYLQHQAPRINENGMGPRHPFAS